MEFTIFNLYDAGFLMAASTGHPPLSIALLTAFYYITGTFGSQNVYILFGLFAAVTVCASCFKEMRIQRSLPLTPLIVLYSLAISLAVSFSQAYFFNKDDYYVLMVSIVLLLELTLYENIVMWKVKALTTVFLRVCVYLANGQVHERNVFILATLAIVYAIMLYGSRDALKLDTPKSEPTTETPETH